MAHAVVQLPAARLATLRTNSSLLLQTCVHLHSCCCVRSSAHTDQSALHNNEMLQQTQPDQKEHQHQQQQQLPAAAAGPSEEDDWLQRSRLLVGADGLVKLSALNVLLVGLGGVGSFAGGLAPPRAAAASLALVAQCSCYNINCCMLPPSSAAEFLCRAGVGSMTIVDGDTVDTTNRNRQLPAVASTVGQLKTEVVAARLTDINPHLRLTVHQVGGRGCV